MGNFVAENNLIQEKVVREYVMEVLLSYTFKEHIMDLDNDDTIVFQLGGIRRSMTMRQFILALRLYTPEEMGNALFEPFCRQNGKEKVTLDDLFLLHSMDGGAKVDVPWHVAKFFTDKAKGYKKKSPIVEAHLIGKIARSYGLITYRSLRSVTLGPETSLLSVVKLVDMGTCRYNRLSYGKMVDDLPNNGENEAAEAGVAMDERLGDIKTNISTLSIEVDDLTYVVLGMSKQYDQFYGEFGQMSLFGDANVGPSTSQNQGNDMDEE
ncbi:hypothetical protein Tco_0670578 [Tanacetum coccineum]